MLFQFSSLSGNPWLDTNIHTRNHLCLQPENRNNALPFYNGYYLFYPSVNYCNISISITHLNLKPRELLTCAYLMTTAAPSR